MLLSKVLGVIVIARNGDRSSFYQDPYTYAASNTETTALGEVSITSFLYLLFVASWYFPFCLGRIPPPWLPSPHHLLRQFLPLLY